MNLPTLSTTLSTAIADAQRAMGHVEWRKALFPVALAAVRRGEHEARPGGEEHIARIVANYSATDMVLVGSTRMLPMDEVRTVEGICAGIKHLETAE